jgi:hypothetical protein
VSVHPSGPDQSLSDATAGLGEPKSTYHADAQYDCSEDPILTYCPEGGFTDDDSILLAIDLVEDTPANNYEGRMKRSLEALLTLQGGTMDLGNNASRESRHQELKHCKIVEVPKFDVNKNSIINLNRPHAYHKNKRRIPAKDRLEQPNTYASKLKGPAP